MADDLRTTSHTSPIEISGYETAFPLAITKPHISVVINRNGGYETEREMTHWTRRIGPLSLTHSARRYGHTLHLRLPVRCSYTSKARVYQFSPAPGERSEPPFSLLLW